MSTFYIYTDKEGKMPLLRYTKQQVSYREDCITHPYFVRYSNNRPIEVNPYPGQTRIWDYESCEYVPINNILGHNKG